MWNMKFYFGLVILVLCSPSVWAVMDLELEFQDKPTMFDIQMQEEKEKQDELIEKQQDMKFLNHTLYKNEYFRIYNNTAYDFDHAQHKMSSGNQDAIGLNDFEISFGYGMELNVNEINKVGYEYVSSFPYDRGQMVRFFWSKIF